MSQAVSAQPARAAGMPRGGSGHPPLHHVFLFPAHPLDGGYDMPRAGVDAFARLVGRLPR